MAGTHLILSCVTTLIFKEEMNAYTILVKNLKGSRWVRIGLCEHSPEAAMKFHKEWKIF
jgi:hypothetical protein